MAKLSNEEIAFAVMGIIPLIGLISLFAKKDSMFVQFYAKQGVILLIACVINSVIIQILSPFALLGWLINALITIIIIIAIVMISRDELWKIPYVYDFSLKIV